MNRLHRAFIVKYTRSLHRLIRLFRIAINTAIKHNHFPINLAFLAFCAIIDIFTMSIPLAKNAVYSMSANSIKRIGVYTYGREKTTNHARRYNETAG